MDSNTNNDNNQATGQENDTSGINNAVSAEMLTEKGINANIAQIIANGDYDNLKAAIDGVVAEEMEKRIVSNIPKAKQTEDFSSELKKFESMGYKDRLALMKSNPRLYNALVEKTLQ